MRDDEGGAALHEVAEAMLNHRFTLGVEGARSFVEDEDARIGENRSGDGKPMTLTAGDLDAALADDGLVAFGEALREFVDAGDPAGFKELLFGGVGAREHYVLANGAVEEEFLLEDKTKLAAIAAQANRGEVLTVDYELHALL